LSGRSTSVMVLLLDEVSATGVLYSTPAS